MGVKCFTKHNRGQTIRLRSFGLPDGPPFTVLYELVTYWYRGEKGSDKDNLLFPTIDTVIQLTGYNKRTIQRAFRSIEKTGLLKPTPGSGVGRTPLQWRMTDRLREVFEMEWEE